MRENTAKIFAEDKSTEMSCPHLHINYLILDIIF